MNILDYWKGYNLITEPYIGLTQLELSDGLYFIKTKYLYGISDNYIAITNENAKNALRMPQIIKQIKEINNKYKNPIGIATIPYNRCDLMDISQLLKTIYFKNSKTQSISEIWIKGSEIDLIDFNSINENLKILGYKLFILNSTFNNNSSLYKGEKELYIEAFVNGYMPSGFKPPESTYYAKNYIGLKSKQNFNIAIGIKEMKSNNIVCCSFLLIGQYHGNKLACFHGDTVVPEHSGKKLQSYTIQARIKISSLYNIKYENMFALVSPNGASAKNYFHNKFTPIDINPITYTSSIDE